MRSARVAAAAVSLLLALGLYQGRKLFIRSWLTQGPSDPPASAAVPPPTGPLHPVRVVLVDGLSARVARTLPAFSRICRDGLTLQVGVGFPSISLPVQHVLWTGTWQNQSGVMFQVRRLPRPVFDSLPARVAARTGTSVAIAESHVYIVASFPFSQQMGPDAGQATLTELELQQASLEAFQSSAALVFVHLLAVDEAGHEVGSSGSAYRDAAARADRLLASLGKVRRPDQTLLVLSDHGHLGPPPGGHGGPESEIALVQGCLAGPGLPAGARVEALLPDLTRILADRLNVQPPRHCQGRTLEGLLRGEPPRPQRTGWTLRLACAGTITLLAWLGLLLWFRRRPGLGLLALPWGLVIAALAVVALEGAPSLSRFYVYRALPLALLAHGLPALLGGAQLLWLVRRGVTPGTAGAALLLGGLMPAIAALVCSGWPVIVPPLVPWLSAWASLLSWLAIVWTLGLGLALAFSSARSTARAS